MTKTIESWESFKYAELWEITERRQGEIYKTKFTGFHVPSTYQLKENETLAAFSTSALRAKTITLNLKPAQ